MNQEQLSELLIVGAKIKIGKEYSKHSKFNEGDIIELIEGNFDNDFVSNVRCPAIYNDITKHFDSIYHLFGNYFESFMDCEILNNNK